MKRLSLPIPTSRRQRGFFRVTALLFSAGLVSAGIVTTSQVRAHQATRAKHLQAGRKLAVKDCGCQPSVSKLRTARLYQTPASADGNHYEQAVSLKAGQRLALGVSGLTGSIQPGGTWDAQFGTVNAGGLYTAPRFTPPEGLDRLHYTDPNGDDVWVNVRILPNPALPASGKTPCVVFDYLHGSPANGGNQTAQAQQSQPAASEAPFAPTAQTIVVLPGKRPAPPLQINDTAPLIRETVNGASVFILPALFGDGTTSAIYAHPLNGTPQLVTLLPDVSPPTGPTTLGEVSVHGPDSIISIPQKDTIDLADGTVSIEVTNGANAILMTRKVGEFHVQGQSYQWKRTRTRYTYTRLHKKWVLEAELHCDAWTQSWITNPPEAVLAEGYPQNNQPLLPYSPDACHP